MKYKILSINNSNVNNIGDYIQGLASSCFLPQNDGFINREKLKDYEGEECKMIMNGWYMHHPEQWPPSEKIHPLFVAFHINSSVANRMLSEEGIAYLKKHQPIGCRDQYTTDLLRDKGIDAYFSGCMTLTLGNTYHSDNKDDKTYFVDPVIPKPNGVFVLINVLILTLNYSVIKELSSRLYEGDTSFKKLIRTAGFFRLYSKIFTKDFLLDSEYINQESSKYTSGFNSDEERLKEAERLVRMYAKAKLVVTKRIHCALPCLGLGTPVIFTAKDKESEISACRFGGLIDLFNVVYCSNKGLDTSFVINEKINKSTIVENKDLWKPLSEELTNRCKEFVKQ